MHILLPTGVQTEEIVRAAAAGFDADVVVTGKVASFLTVRQLIRLIESGTSAYDLVLVSGMCTADFSPVETATGVPVYRGPCHAADLPLILPLLGTISLSRTIPADELIALERREQATGQVAKQEAEAKSTFLLKNCKIGGSSRMKVLAEIMDAHRRENLLEIAQIYLEEGADILDLGFGFDATPEDVTRVFSTLEGLNCVRSVDTQDPALIRAALPFVDLVLSLHEDNIPLVGEEVAAVGCAAVIVPHEQTLSENLAAAKAVGIITCIADPLLQPVGSGLVPSLAGFEEFGVPLFFGAGNVTELLDADSVGVNALLAGMAYEVGASVIFTSEHSDKTRGSVREIRTATEMMALMEGRPYPKDLGLDLFCIKEKRRRREPPLKYNTVVVPAKETANLEYDPCGNFRIGIEGDRIVAVLKDVAYTGTTWEEVFAAIIAAGNISLLDHAAYLGKELYKAELGLRFGRSFEQDGPF